ncbi:restriction endonuclease subunit S [Novosphingobium sp. SL115]|uniref:restriction endonuclease subunit S n=1 Tax=Novosphingobium sp. SL115 TaxID=2995150 RepID=UPI0022724C4F|nr:restriction endonuclease subunit S [Novosphingobium sp. SL115]MCY1670187.1 restriction endonuclease subunit S [Novosphingobium sp. SL115]
MIEGWREYRIDDLAEIRNQIRVPLSKLERSQRIGPYPYYGASGIIDYVDDFLFEGTHVLISEDGENLKSRNTPIAFKAEGQFWVNNHAHIVRGRKAFHNDLICQYFSQIDLSAHITGAVQPKLSKASLLNIPIFLPEDESEQEAIAEVLSSLDDKINLLHRQNATLEALAETLFRQYFIEGAQDDWEEGTLDDVLTVKGGTTPSTKNAAFWDGDIHWTSPRDLSANNGLFLLDTARKITSEGLAQIGSGLLPAGSLLMSSRAPVGYLAFSVNPVAINQGYIGILDDKGFSKEFIFLWLKINMEYVKGHANGSTFQEISKSTFKKLEITKPPEQLRQEFQGLVMPLFQKLLECTLQCQKLQQLRDTLLPKLMSGQVRVSVSV